MVRGLLLNFSRQSDWHRRGLDRALLVMLTLFGWS